MAKGKTVSIQSGFFRQLDLKQKDELVAFLIQNMPLVKEDTLVRTLNRWLAQAAVENVVLLTKTYFDLLQRFAQERSIPLQEMDTNATFERYICWYSRLNNQPQLKKKRLLFQMKKHHTMVSAYAEGAPTYTGSAYQVGGFIVISLSQPYGTHDLDTLTILIDTHHKGLQIEEAFGIFMSVDHDNHIYASMVLYTSQDLDIQAQKEKLASQKLMFSPQANQVVLDIQRKKNVLSNLGKKIVQLRQQLNMSQTEFANQLGTNQKRVSRWESGFCSIPASCLEKISHLCHVDFSYWESEEILPDSEQIAMDDNAKESHDGADAAFEESHDDAADTDHDADAADE